MRKILLISAAAVLICAIISITASSLTAPEKELRTQTQSSYTDGGQVYVLKEYKGLVAVFKEGGEIPVKITQTHAASLPPCDAEMLKDGIRVEGEENLRKILMDFCS